MCRKNDAASTLENLLYDTCSDGEVAIIWSDGGTKFQGSIQDLCLKHQIQREMTPRRSPHFNESVERCCDH